MIISKKTKIFRICPAFITIIIISLINVSCKKYLAEKSDKSLVELKSLNDLQAMLNNNTSLNINTTPDFGEASSDDYFIQPSSFSSLSQPQKETYTWSVTEYIYYNDWAIGYRGAYISNYILDRIEPPNESNLKQWKAVKGSALFHRSFRYLGLVWEYGKAFDSSSFDTDLGIVLRQSSNPTTPSTRASVRQCYDQIIRDAKAAADLLENFSSSPMQPSKWAAYSLLARAYLSMRNYDSSFKYSNLSLSLRSDLLNYNNPNEVQLDEFPPFNNSLHREIIFYSTETTNHTSKSSTYASIDTSLYNSYQANDLRKRAYFFENNGFHAFKGTYGLYGIDDFFSGLAVDEMYLIRAESYARKSRPEMENALKDLNTLLEKRHDASFIPYKASSFSELVNLILTERRKELLMRGLRWSDIKRLNKENKAITLQRLIDGALISLPPNDKKYALPLPYDIIEITGMPQN